MEPKLQISPNCKDKRKSTAMFEKVKSFFDKSKKSRNSFGSGENYDLKSMDWQDEDNEDEADRQSIDSSSEVKLSYLVKSASEASITAVTDYNYRTQGVQVSFETCEPPKNIRSRMKNLVVRYDDDGDSDESVAMPTSPKNCTIHDYNQSDDHSCRYGIPTQDITTKQVVMQGNEILNFQGDVHSPNEIARHWKKDCRMWLWKSTRITEKESQV